MTRLIGRGSSRQQDRHRIVRVNFRPARRPWWDDQKTVSTLLVITVLAIGILVLLPGR